MCASWTSQCTRLGSRPTRRLFSREPAGRRKAGCAGGGQARRSTSRSGGGGSAIGMRRCGYMTRWTTLRTNTDASDACTDPSQTISLLTLIWRTQERHRAQQTVQYRGQGKRETGMLNETRRDGKNELCMVVVIYVVNLCTELFSPRLGGRPACPQPSDGPCWRRYP